jgi:membrane-associated phospholipid phosphatase
LWRRYDAIGARRLLDLGAVLVFVELVSRLYLGRHLLADIVGGFLLGIVLAVVGGWLLHLVEPAAADEPRGRSSDR